jgi:hypothetical protein
MQEGTMKLPRYATQPSLQEQQARTAALHSIRWVWMDHVAHSVSSQLFLKPCSSSWFHCTWGGFPASVLLPLVLCKAHKSTAQAVQLL